MAFDVKKARKIAEDFMEYLEPEDKEFLRIGMRLRAACNEIERHREENRRLREALTRILEHPNSMEHHHPDECELRKVDPEEQDDETCTCGYWAASYPELKLIARSALSSPTDPEEKG
jgi:hypothetical protein